LGLRVGVHGLGVRAQGLGAGGEGLGFRLLDVEVRSWCI